MYFNLGVMREKKCHSRGEKRARNTESALITILTTIYCRNALEVTTRVYTYEHIFMHTHRIIYIHTHTHTLVPTFTCTLSHAASSRVCEYTHRNGASGWIGTSFFPPFFTRIVKTNIFFARKKEVSDNFRGKGLLFIWIDHEMNLLPKLVTAKKEFCWILLTVGNR